MSQLLRNNFIKFLFLFILIIFISYTYFQNNADAISPSFPRQVIIDGSKDWFPKNLLKAPNSSFNTTQCNEKKSFFPSYPDIEEINYLSDGKFLNATIWLSSFFEEPKQYHNFSFNIEPSKKPQSSIDKNIVAVDVKNFENKNMNLNEFSQQKIFSLKKLPSFTNMQASTTLLSKILAYKVTYEYTKQNDNIKALKIWTIANDKIYTITYLAEKERFDTYLPFVQNIINSFEIIKNNSYTLNNPLIDNNYQNYINESLELRLQYPMDWKKETNKNNPALVIFSPPYTEPLFKTGRIIVMAMDVNSGYDFRGEDYRVTLDWDPTIRNWTRLVQESKASMGEDRTLDSGEYLILEQQKNYGGFLIKKKITSNYLWISPNSIFQINIV